MLYHISYVNPLKGFITGVQNFSAKEISHVMAYLRYSIHPIFNCNFDRKYSDRLMITCQTLSESKPELQIEPKTFSGLVFFSLALAVSQIMHHH